MRLTSKSLQVNLCYVGHLIKYCVFQRYGSLFLTIACIWRKFHVGLISLSPSLTLQFPTHMANESWTKNEPTSVIERQSRAENPPLSKAKKLPLQVLFSFAYLLLRTSHSPHAISYYFHIFTQLLLHCHPFLSCPTLSLCQRIYSAGKASTTWLHHLFRLTWSTTSNGCVQIIWSGE